MGTPQPSLAARAFAPDIEDGVDAFGERILDAALEQFRIVGIRRSTIDDVARRAKVGRVTVFRRFESKDGLVRALLLREGRRLMDQIDAAMVPGAEIEDQIVESFLRTLRAVQRHPLMTGMLAAEPETLLPLLTVEGGEGLALARALLVRHVRAAHKQAGVHGDPEQTAELLARIGLSLVLTPATTLPLEDDEQARDFARRHLVPMVLGSRAPHR
jgi:AcrR family transcriptional regulator